MKKSTLFKFSFLFVILTLSSCKKKDNQTIDCGNGNTVLFPMDAFERFYFTDSTYWIYRDSISGQVDSVWVQHSETSSAGIQTSDAESKNKCFQYGENTIQSVLGENYQVTLLPRGKNSGSYFSEIYIFIKKSGLTLSFALLEDSLFLNDGLGDGDIFFRPNILVNGVEFKNVLQWNNTTSIPVFYKKAYYVRNIGLVKYTASNGRVWELLRYRIR